MDIVKKGDFNTNGAGYPPLQTYLISGLIGGKYISNNSNGVYRDDMAAPDSKPIFKPLDKLTQRDIFGFHVIGRLFSSLCAGATAVMVYMLCREFVPSWAATLAALSLLFLPSHVEQGHYLLPNTFNALLAISSTYAAVRYVRDASIVVLYASVALAALAISTKMNVTVAAAPIAAFLIRFAPAQAKHVVLLPACAFAVLFATYPYAFLDPKTFVEQYSGILWSYNFEDVWVRVTDPYFAWSAWLFRQSPIWFCVSLAGALVMLVKSTRAGIVFLLPAGLYFYTRCGMTYYFPQRDLIPLLPFLSAGFGLAIYAVFNFPKRALAERLAPRKTTIVGIAATATICIFAFYPLLVSSSAVIKQFISKDPLQVAQAWVDENVPKSARIYSENYLSTVPASDDGYNLRWDAKARPQFYFEDPYCTYGDVEYVIAACAGAYDKMPWLRKLRQNQMLNGTRLGKKPEILDAFLAGNRDLFEKRITPTFVAANPDYRVVAEWGIAWPTVSIYKIPEMVFTDVGPADLWQRISPENIAIAPPEEVKVAGISSAKGLDLQVPVTLPIGITDVFFESSAEYANGQEAPQLNANWGEGISSAIPIIFLHRRYYTASSISSSTVQPSKLTVRTPPPTPAKGTAYLKTVRFARIIDSTQGIGVPAAEIDYGTLGPNMLEDSSFEQGKPLPAAWTTNPAGMLLLATDASTRISGNVSLRSELASSLNLGIAHRPVTVTPGKTLVLKGYIKARDLDGSARLEVQDAEKGWQSFISVSPGITGTTPWHWVHTRFVVPENVTSLRVFLRRPNQENDSETKGTIWWDAVELSEVQS